ncbi:MAG: hypothetical protein U0744_11690 [Gemmataceae bacterium]
MSPSLPAALGADAASTSASCSALADMVDCPLGDAPARVRLYYGVRTSEPGRGRRTRVGGAEGVHLASNDGSIGHHGFITDLLDSHPAPQHLFGCGPEPMLYALAKLAERKQIPCHVSLETPMACGVGICFSCVTRVKTDDGWDYKRVCVDGPVFESAKLCWD